MPTPIDRVRVLIRAHAQDLDQATVDHLAALSGLIACVVYADRRYTEAEQAHVREDLSRVHGLTAVGVDALCATLAEHVVELGTCSMQAHTRLLREAADVEQRLDVLHMLVDLAAADGTLSMEETNLLRRTAAALGLSAADYLSAQARHRDRLSLLA